eukprot:scaffold271372_cov15-Tisochrysis_lutea.AAC.1
MAPGVFDMPARMLPGSSTAIRRAWGGGHLFSSTLECHARRPLKHPFRKSLSGSTWEAHSRLPISKGPSISSRSSCCRRPGAWPTPRKTLTSSISWLSPRLALSS